MTAIFGDSLTAGNLGIPYIPLLKTAVQPFGINGDTMLGVTARALKYLQRRIKKNQPPDALILECCSNDLLLPYMAKVSDGWDAATRMLIKPGREPIPDIKQLLREYGSRLSLITRAASTFPGRTIPVAVTTIPLLGEDLNSLLNRQKRELNRGLRRICSSGHIHCIDPEFRFEQHLLAEADQEPAGPFFPDQAAPDIFLTDERIIAGSIQAAMRLSRERHLLLTTDGLHFNGEGARLFAEELQVYLSTRN